MAKLTSPIPRPSPPSSGAASGRVGMEVAAARNGAQTRSQPLYRRLRAPCYHRLPGVGRLYDTDSLTRLIEEQDLTVVEHIGEPGAARVLART